MHESEKWKWNRSVVSDSNDPMDCSLPGSSVHLGTFFSYKYLNGIFNFALGPQILGFPGGSAVKNPLVNAGDAGLIPGSGISPGEGNGNPLLYSCLGNPMDRRTLAKRSRRVRFDLATKTSPQILNHLLFGLSLFFPKEQERFPNPSFQLNCDKENNSTLDVMPLEFNSD